MKIQDDIDRQFTPRAMLEIEKAPDHKLPALYYRAFDAEGIMRQNGWIEKDDLIELRKMIDEVLGDEGVPVECDACKALTSEYSAAVANNLWQTARAKDRILVAHQTSHATGPR